MNKWLLAQVMNYLIGKDVFGQVQKLVTLVALNPTLTGDEKKAKVLEGLKDIGGDVAAHLLNLAIEAAVTLLKDKIK